MFYLYAVLSAVAILILGNFFPLFQMPFSWWLVPVAFVALWFGLCLLQIILFVVSLLLIHPNSPPERLSKFYRWEIKMTLPLVFKLVGVKIHVTGVEKVPQDKRVLVVCNHIHDFDPAIIINELPDLQLGFIAKKEIYVTLKFIAKIMRKLNCLPIDRENDREAVKTIVSAIKLIKEDRASVAVFPEGYTSLDGQLHEFRNGAFKVATKAKCPIVVCALDGTNIILKNLFRRKTDIYFDVAAVIDENEVNEMNTAQISEKVHKIMEDALAKIEQKKQAARRK